MKPIVAKLVRLLIGCAVVGGVVILAFLVGPMLLGHAKANKQDEGRADAEIPVTVESAVSRNVERRVNVVGTLEGFEDIQISAKVEGRVTRVHRDMGDLVAPGDPLCDIDPTDYRLSANEAERALELELAKLGLTELNGKSDIDMAKLPLLLRAKNLEENALQLLARARRLNSSRVISSEEWEKVQTESKVANANRIHAELEARSTLASARLRAAQVETAKQKIIDTRICAPQLSASRLPTGIDPKSIRFVVASRKVAEGEMCRVFPSGTIFRLVIDRPLKLVAQVPERFVGEVRLNQPVSLTTEAYPGETFAGRITRLNPTIERASRSFMVEVTIPNEERQLRVGSFVKASIVTRKGDSVVTVPEEAVVRYAGVVKVFVIEGDRARTVTVRTGEQISVTEGRKSRRWVEVVGKVEPGAKIAVSGQSQLAEGSKVTVRASEPRTK